MPRLRSASLGVALALVVSAAVMPLAYAVGQPGDPCPTEGQVKPLGSGSIVCTSGVWQPANSAPGATPSSPAAPGSTAKVAKIFKPVGTALSQDTFGSTGKQVADATAFRLPDGRVRVFAFVNVTTGLPGLRSATSTTKAGTSFVSDGTDPFPGTPVGQPRAFPLGGNSLRLFFAEAGTVQTAVSSDGGVTFTRQGPVLTTAQAGFEPGVISVIKHKGIYRAYFSNLERPGVHAERVMRTATSPDLMTWTVGPSVVAEGGSHPFAITDRTGKVALYYAADRGSTYGI
ncbi:MAG: sialidase family protein, partial [Candidatus Nanopelagicales bacterium]